MIELLNRNVVVLVDDNEAEGELARICWQRAGRANSWLQFVNPIEFLQFDSAVQRGTEPAPALILLDINMPQMSGFDVLRQLRGDRARAERLHVLMLSNSDSPKEREQALRLGADWFSPKPASVGEYVTFFRQMEPVDH